MQLHCTFSPLKAIGNDEYFKVFISTESVSQIDMQQALTSAGGSDFCLEALKACSADAKVGRMVPSSLNMTRVFSFLQTCEVAARGLARLVYKNEEAKLRLKDQPVCSVLMLVLMKHRNDSSEALKQLTLCLPMPIRMLYYLSE